MCSYILSLCHERMCNYLLSTPSLQADSLLREAESKLREGLAAAVKAEMVKGYGEDLWSVCARLMHAVLLANKANLGNKLNSALDACPLLTFSLQAVVCILCCCSLQAFHSGCETSLEAEGPVVLVEKVIPLSLNFPSIN